MTNAPMNSGCSPRWVETPMFILRRDCLRRATAEWHPGRFLELGAGTGRLTAEFLARQFVGACYDLGEHTRDLLRQYLARFGESIQVIDSLDEIPKASFDYVFAFEVLEHIAADAQVLRSWVEFLRPGGHLLISVPAHMRKFGAEDRAVGHCRRYEKRQLSTLLEEAGCDTVRVLSYGFPVAIVTRRSNELLSYFRTHRAPDDATPEDLSILSGTERSAASVRFAKVLNRRTLAPFVALQRLFFATDLGDGYVAHAVRAEKARQAGR